MIEGSIVKVSALPTKRHLSDAVRPRTSTASTDGKLELQRPHAQIYKEHVH